MKGWQKHRETYVLYFCILFLFFQVLRCINGLCLSQLGDAFIFQARQDPLVWLYVATGIPEFILCRDGLTLFFDVLVFLLPVMLYFTQRKKVYRFAWLFFAIYSLYLLTAFSYPTLSIRKYLGLAVIPLIFSSHTKEEYIKLTCYFRYFVCFIFASAALWKMTRGTLFDGGQFVTILTTQHFEHSLFAPGHISTQIAHFLMAHPTLAYVFYIMVGLFQLAFISGFFTRKFDKYLALAMILFVVGDFLVMRIEYWEFAVFLPLFFLPLIDRPNKH